MLFRTEKTMKEHISGVILFDETIRQKAKDGTPLVKLIEAAGSVPGIKVDAGAKPLAGAPGETITEGLDGLRERFVEYHELARASPSGAASIEIANGKPSHNAIHANAQALARYAALAQENGIVPIVEPELLMDGDQQHRALRSRHRMDPEGSFPGTVFRRRGAGRHRAQAQHGGARA